MRIRIALSALTQKVQILMRCCPTSHPRGLPARARFLSSSPFLMLPTLLAPHHYQTQSLAVKPALPTFLRNQKCPPVVTFLPSHGSHRAPPLKVLHEPRSLREAFGSLSQKNPPGLPSQEDYAFVLELCAFDRALSQGQQIHARIVTSAVFTDDGFLGTKLVFMYGKCGCFSLAQQMFDEMLHRTIFSWNALLGAYASSDGQQHRALELYRAMRFVGVSPDACTLSTLMKACAGTYDLDCGSEAHGLAIKFGFMSTVFVVNSLVAMYAKCGQLDAARRLFEWLPEKSDVVSWNSMISSCVQNGQWFEALRLFTEMQMAEVEMNSYTTVSVFQACAELFLLKLGEELHASLLKRGRPFEIFVSNALVVMYARCGRMGDSALVFSEMTEKDNVSWNSMLSGYVQNKLYHESINFFLKMQDAGCIPDKVSVVNIASPLAQLGNFLGGREVHAYAVRHGFHDDTCVGNSLMGMYTKCSHEEYAERVFRTMPDRDYISWTAIITAYTQSSHHFEALCLFREVLAMGLKVDVMMIGAVLRACSGLKCLLQLKEAHTYVVRRGLSDLMLENMFIDAYGECGKDEYAVRVFNRIDNKDLISWTSMINCYIQNGLPNEALGLFYVMRDFNLQLDAVALVSILGAIADLSALRKGKEIHGFLIRKGFTVDTSVINSLVDMHARCGDIDTCHKLFDRVESKDLVLWTTMIDANGMHGQGMEAVDLFKRMQERSVVPDHVCFLALLYACSHSGLLDEGKDYLEIMKADYKLEPWLEHYACIVDLLSRSGQINEAYNFIMDMPITPTATVWCALLRGCQIYSSSKVGKLAADRLLELEPENPGNYVLVSNVFAASGKWDDVEEIRMRMKEKELKKSPACSWIEMGNEMHSFTAGDNTHPKSAIIYSKLSEITEHLEKEFGYIRDTSFALHDVKEDEKVKFLNRHSERLAITLGLIETSSGMPIRITKNLRVCGDCHEFTKLVSKLFKRHIIVRDSNRFHHFKDGSCSCGDFW